MKLTELQYSRQNKQEILDALDSFKAQFDNAKTADDFMLVHDKYREFSEKLSTNIQIASIRFSLDTRDQFYTDEQNYYDEILPEIGVKSAEVSKCYLTSSCREALEKVFPKVLFTNLQMQVDANDERLVEFRVKENKLTTEYSKVLSAIKIDHEGGSYTLAQIGKFFNSADREVRRSAYLKYGQAIEDNKDDLDRLYHQLVAVRHEMAQSIGDENYMRLASLGMQRNCYTREDIAHFRANVLKHLVPLVTRIKGKVAETLGIDKMYLFDDSVYTEVEPKPIGTVEEIFANGSKMYNEMSTMTGELFDRMVASECFDVVAREGKAGGGYCTELSRYRIPFIFANFNGTSGDIDVLTHEFGHAIAAHMGFKKNTEFLTTYSMETAEVHSMSMEFLAYPWMDKFFGENTEQYKFCHIASALSFIPYGTIVDYFQELAYTNPNATPLDRINNYNELEKQFMPWTSSEGIAGFCDGRRWQRQAHIYEVPFYYIDYCLAQFTALQFLSLSLENYDNAFESYLKFVEQVGTKTFVELIESSGLESPFEEDSFIKVTTAIGKLLGV